MTDTIICRGQHHPAGYVDEEFCSVHIGCTFEGPRPEQVADCLKEGD
jgi:hypothetical protein